MKLPIDAEISEDKIVNYLLKHRSKNDKSRLLNLAGYNQSNYQKLIEDLRTQILTLKAVLQKSSLYGKTYEISGILKTPVNTEIRIKTIWIIEYSSGKTKLITLFPLKEK